MSGEIAARYAACSTAELFELARAGESRLRPEAWQSLKNELRKRGLELTPEDESLASGPASASLTTDSELPGSEQTSDAEPAVAVGVDAWLGFFLVLVTLTVSFLTYKTLAAFVALSWVGVLYGLLDIVMVIGIVLVYHRDPLAPRFWRAVLILTAGLAVFLGAGHLIAWFFAAPAAAMSIAWASYWNNSPRVRATFVIRPPANSATELDPSTTSPDEELKESSAPVEFDAEPVPSVEELNAELDDARRQGNFAVVYIVLGLVVTIGTYIMASSRGGGTYTIAWGAVLFGMFGAARAKGRQKRARALLQRRRYLPESHEAAP